MLNVARVKAPIGAPDLLTVAQMADALGVSQNTVRSLCRAGELPAVHIGRRWYVHRARLDELMGVR